MLKSFHASVAQWFADTFDEPTQVQLDSWPVIAAGANALITAPTGSGKTLTAFLWALSELARHAEQTNSEANVGRTTRVLYISPLKALNNDIQRNLMQPLATLQTNYGYPDIKVETRSGDTPQNVRQRLLRHPPDILITTPESLGLMLTNAKGRMALGNIDTVILDEVHSIVDNRRGVALMANLERLSGLCGGFQRIALSATVTPLQAVAGYVAGYENDGSPRAIEVVDAAGTKAIDFRVRFPQAAKLAADEGKKIWEPLSDSFRDLINANQSTLFFTNSRRLAEKITLKINQDQVGPIAYAHHGSLARDVRTEVEHRLKQGQLQAIVATNSLEMGIDIGHLDEVVMVQSPPSVASTLQRLGRAGHQVGETSVGTLFPTHAHDFLEAAALAEAVAARNIEPQHLMFGALDVLAQFVISTTASEPWPVDDLYTVLQRSAPYHGLDRGQFDLVIEMLSGRYAGSRIRELKPRITHDRIHDTVQANKGALLALYNSGGTIPDRGYFQLRHKDTGAVLGELDEEFVWEATVGDNFTLGTQHWQIHRITHNDVMVRPAKPGSSAPPFWRSEFFNRSFHFSQQIAQYLSLAEERLAAHDAHLLTEQLTQDKGFEQTAADELVEYLQRQREHTQTPLPHRHHLLLEKVKTGPAGYRGPDDPQQLVIHTFWGGQLNHPWALALRAAWAAKHQQKLDIHADNNALVLQLKGDIDPHEILALVNNENLLELLRASLEGSGFFGARFRECAGRALLLTKQKFNQRLPLWMSRMQAKKLMAQVKRLNDFPVLLETWRTCLDDEFNLPALQGMLSELAEGQIEWSFVSTTSPSPFSHNLTFGQVSRYMYADDTPEDELTSQLNEDVIGAALHNNLLRPGLEAAIVDEFVSKRQRRAAGYAPETDDEWHEWLQERILIPIAEWPEQLTLPPNATIISCDTRQWVTHLNGVYQLAHCGLYEGPVPDNAPELTDPRDDVAMAREILSFYGPLSEAEIATLLPTVPASLLYADDTLICGTLLKDDDTHYWCDAENFDILLRFQRASRRTHFEPQPVQDLPLFWAGLANLHAPDNQQNVLQALENLRGYATHVDIWLHDLMASRTRQTAPGVHWREHYENSEMAWLGSGKEQITIAYPEELGLWSGQSLQGTLTDAFVDPAASYTFQQVADSLNLGMAELNEQWWPAVWQGQLISQDLMPLAQAAQRKYSMQDLGARVSSRRRLARSPRSWAGYWQLVPQADDEDALTRLENDKERVRLLLDRYGFVNRDIVNREQWRTSNGSWRWRDAFRALRIMELSGEVLTGSFFNQLATPQFISPRAFNALQNNSQRCTSFWINACDPVSPCGLNSEVRAAWTDLPQRRPGNYLSFFDGKLALIIENQGQSLTYLVPADHPQLSEIQAPLEHLVEQRRVHVQISQINGTEARTSAYLAGLNLQFNLTRDHKQVTLQPNF